LHFDGVVAAAMGLKGLRWWCKGADAMGKGVVAAAIGCTLE